MIGSILNDLSVFLKFVKMTENVWLTSIFVRSVQLDLFDHVGVTLECKVQMQSSKRI